MQQIIIYVMRAIYFYSVFLLVNLLIYVYDSN
jgi:hypothetical protein